MPKKNKFRKGVADQTTSTKLFVGIVDNLGLASFVEKGKTDFPFAKRAVYGGQRQSTAFEVYLTKETEKQVNDLLEKGEFIEAGAIIKKLI